MREIARVEQDELLLSSILSDVPGADTTSAPSSFHPFEMSLSSKESERLPYLPCHYFDYVAGSGTGGYRSSQRLITNIHVDMSNVDLANTCLFIQTYCHYAGQTAHDAA